MSTLEEPPADPVATAAETAEELRDDLEAIAASNLPFAQDAQRILKNLRKYKEEHR